jgi:two-component system response regulator YesN
MTLLPFPAKRTAPPDSPVAWVTRLKDLIDRNYTQPLTLRALAATVEKDRAYVATMFRRHTGETLHGYLTSVRMRRAAELIAQGHKIDAVVFLVGYRSKKSFYHQFRARMGVTPGSYRAAARRDTSSLGRG